MERRPSPTGEGVSSGAGQVLLHRPEPLGEPAERHRVPLRSLDWRDRSAEEEEEVRLHFDRRASVLLGAAGLSLAMAVYFTRHTGPGVDLWALYRAAGAML